MTDDIAKGAERPSGRIASSARIGDATPYLAIA